MNSAYLWRRPLLATSKKQNHFSLPEHRLAENLIFVFGFYERTRKRWKGYCNQTCRNYSYDYFHLKNKIFATQGFFDDHLKHKTLNKTTCTTPSADPSQLCEHSLKCFPTAMIIFWGFQDFLIYLTKYFWSLLNSPDLIFQVLFCNSKVNETV